MTVDIISLEDAKLMLKTDSSVTKKDLAIQSMISQASSVLESFCRREFDKKERTESFDTRDARRVYLDISGQSESGYGLSASGQVFSLKSQNVDLTQPFEVRYSECNDFTDSSSIMDPAYYILDEVAGTLTVTYGTLSTVKGLRVKYTGGYAVTAAANGLSANLSASAPPNLKLACSIQVAFLYDKFMSNSFGVHQQYGEQGRMYANKGILPPEVMELLMPFRRHFVR